MTGNKCKSCGSAELEVDPARGDTVCTNCGTVLEDSVIVSEVQFEENAHGGSSALGQFVSSDSKGGCRGFGSNFHSGLAKESREITLQNAKRGISNLCQQLRLNQHCIDTAYNFYKLALTRQLTRGRKNPHVLAACVYITCRIEGTPHLLIDFSEVLQIDAFELGKTYLRLSQALCIKIPSMDPCLYVLRYANKLDFGDKTHEVAMTALRLVQRMKKDSLHSGRHPSGLCGAALLMAARLHDFSRSVNNIIQIVNIHESTLKKRLFEFGETISGTLTPEEFLSVDLEEEQDPPSYKAARLKDKERLHKLMEDDQSNKQLTELQQEIERQLDLRQQKKKKRKRPDLGDSLNTSDIDNQNDQIEEQDTNQFVLQSTVGVIEQYLENGEGENTSDTQPNNSGIGPSMESLGIEPSPNQQSGVTMTTVTSAIVKPVEEEENFDLEGLDDDEINSYIMTQTEAILKHNVWVKVNANYLKEQKEKEEKLAKAREEGKPEKKRRKYSGKKNKNIAPSHTAGEAIKKMLQEKKISSKINYDVLKSLNVSVDSENKHKVSETASTTQDENVVTPATSVQAKSKSETIKPPIAARTTTTKNIGSKRTVSFVTPTTAVSEETNSKQPTVEDNADRTEEELPNEMDDYEEDEDVEVEPEGEMSLSQMLNQHRDDEEYYGYDDEDY